MFYFTLIRLSVYFPDLQCYVGQGWWLCHDLCEVYCNRVSGRGERCKCIGWL